MLYEQACIKNDATADRLWVNPELTNVSRVLWSLGWSPRTLYAIGVLVALCGALTVKSPGGLLLGLVVLIIRWKSTVLINETSARLIGLAEARVAAEGAKRLGLDLNSSECKVIFIGQSVGPFGIRVEPEYNVCAIYICDAFFSIYSGTSFSLETFQLRLATTGDEVYFRHVIAVDYRNSKIEITLSRGDTSKHIAVGSDANATVLLEPLRAKLRTTQGPATSRAAVVLGRASEDDVKGSDEKLHTDTEEDLRHCYLRHTKLMEYYSDPTVLSALIEQLQVPGTASTLKRMSDAEKKQAIESQIDHFRQTPNSFWYGVPQLEVLAASIWRARGVHLKMRLVADKFYAVAREEDLMRPVAQWLTARGDEAYMEIPLGRRRIDVLGYNKAGLISSARLTAVELKNSDEQFRRGPDQMATFAEYAHSVYLACTPAFAAEYLERNADNRNVNHWDPCLLDRKLKQCRFGLLIVERNKVFEVIRPAEQTVADAKIGKIVSGLSSFQRIELE